MFIDRAHKKRLLMLTHRFPYPPNRGDRIRSYNLLRVLSDHFGVTLGSTTDEPIRPEDLNHVESLCEDVCVEPVGRYRRVGRALKSYASRRSLTEGMFASPALAQRVLRWQQNCPFDAVLVFCSSMYPYVDQTAFDSTPKVVDLVDVDSQKWRQMSQDSRSPKKFLYATEAVRVRKLERRIAGRADALVLVSHHEAELFRQTVSSESLHQTPVYGISNGVDTQYFSPSPGPSEPVESPLGSRFSPLVTSKLPALSLVFTGVLDYRPNVEGIDWFCRQILPAMRSAANVRLAIVGRRPCKRVLDLASVEGVNVVGEVPDVRPYLHDADVAISPLKLARGIQNKVLEAMAAALPVVVTSQSAEGIDAVSGNEFVIADTVEQWQAALSSLADAPDERTRMGMAGRRFVESEYSWAARLAKFVDLIHSCSPSDAPDPSPRPLITAV